MKNACFFKTKYGLLFIAEEDSFLTNVTIVKEKFSGDFIINETSVIKKAYSQLKEYFDGKRKKFDLPINPKGTPFQKLVWEQLRKIPYGKTMSYKDIAIMAGNPKACRAVGMANNKNPIIIITPCHRVIGSNGSLTGFGCGLELKQKLLNLETTHK